MIIEEVLLQRYEGVKNEKGVWVTPAFPKLIYVLQEDNITPGSEYYYLTELAAKVHRKAHGAGLHLRKEDERAQRRQLLPGHGLPQRVKPVEG